jgi:ABC-type polysaccharide/polyol phosphate export permease
MTQRDSAAGAQRPDAGARAVWSPPAEPTPRLGRQPGARLAAARKVRELWAYRELVLFLAVRDLQVRYKQAAFGILWAVLQPLAGAAVFLVVFGRLADISSDGLPYLLFAFLGYAAWTYFATSLAAANASLVSNSALVTKVYFPRLAAPLSSVLPGWWTWPVALVVTAC